MKKRKFYLIGVILLLLIAGIGYYVTLPAINLHSEGMWGFIFTLCLVAIFVYVCAKCKHINSFREMTPFFKKSVPLKIMLAVFLIFLIVYAGGSILSSPLVNASKYQKLLQVKER